GDLGEGSSGRKDIHKLLKPGQKVLVQVTKEGRGDKGPALTTYLSLPGRCLVLMPGLNRRGVSRKIDDESERDRLRNIIKNLDVPNNTGLIARTASENKSKKEMERDLQYLLRLWKVVENRAEQSSSPSLLYRESDQVIRVMRDVFNEQIKSIIIDSEDVHSKVKDFVRNVMPRHVRKVKLYQEDEPLFHAYGVEKELDKMHSRTVQLDSGGSIVLEQTEALVAIDVNSGQYKGKADAEETAFRTNMEAAPEIARQVRLRDLGGVLVIDFIDMEDGNRRKEVEKALWNAMKKDRSRWRMLKMSPFCLVEITRQRQRGSWRDTTFEECPTCAGRGQVKSAATLGLEVVRRIRYQLGRKDVKSIEVVAPPKVVNYINNSMRNKVYDLEQHFDKPIQIVADTSIGQEHHRIKLYKSDGKQVAI
ncbi:MAG: Rne/Rng family ribonuclease, partial [Planctomycetota bacterium]